MNELTRNGAAGANAYPHAASYHVFKFQGSSDNSEGGNSGQDRQTIRQFWVGVAYVGGP
ncbi:hypothetical protein DPMN_176497 [Dreissena polymorpha]|uniref:Uncharacterized protein n=1 Tax=Dreissena polymorpha TaxID=45954 RepID=A0A9D4II49_DREPO|nr:hypothetical protein DPMN_176497 [Dreissena polymorpha]